MCIVHAYTIYIFTLPRKGNLYTVYLPTYSIVRLYTHTYVDIYMHF